MDRIGPPLHMHWLGWHQEACDVSSDDCSSIQQPGYVHDRKTPLPTPLPPHSHLAPPSLLSLQDSSSDEEIHRRVQRLNLGPRTASGGARVVVPAAAVPGHGPVPNASSVTSSSSSRRVPVPAIGGHTESGSSAEDSPERPFLRLIVGFLQHVCIVAPDAAASQRHDCHPQMRGATKRHALVLERGTLV